MSTTSSFILFTIPQFKILQFDALYIYTGTYLDLSHKYDNIKKD